jgi:hypothetical protein
MVLKDVLALPTLPKRRPGPFTGLVYALTAICFTWNWELRNIDDHKAQLETELVNTAITSALLLTIAAAPLYDDPPSYLPDTPEAYGTFYFLWTIATILMVCAWPRAAQQPHVYAACAATHGSRFTSSADGVMHQPGPFTAVAHPYPPRA